jgi:SAM-dependent MidA family methyltransferase
VSLPPDRADEARRFLRSLRDGEALEQALFPEAGDPVLEERVRRLIRDGGAITFAHFMDLVLYDPERGYYSSRAKIGFQGDFLTSPEFHPAFGSLIARWIARTANDIQLPELCVVEMGAGSGALAEQVLETLPEARYCIVETSPALIEAQRARFGRRVTWAASLEELAPIRGIVISNELVDAFPVHRVRVREGRLRELYVGLEGDRLIEVEADPSTPDLQAYFERLGLRPPEGAAAEVNLRARDWIRGVGRALARGAVLTVDYGAEAAELYRDRPEGTLRGYWRHTITRDPFVRLGRQDMTSHVDFTSLAAAGREVGLEPEPLRTQRDFLLDLGFRDFENADLPARLMAGLLALIDPEGLGNAKVLVQRKKAAPESA